MTDSIRGVILFGDSIFSGTGAADRQRGCAKLVKDALEVPISIRSRNRETSTMGLSRIGPDVLQQSQYSHVLVLFGNNDCWLNSSMTPAVSSDQFAVNLECILSAIHRNGQRPLACNLQPIDNKKFFSAFPEYQHLRVTKLDPNAWQRKYSDQVEIVSRELGVRLVDIRSVLEREAGAAIANDGLHPNDRGHEIIATAILDALKTLDSTLQVRSRVLQASKL